MSVLKMMSSLDMLPPCSSSAQQLLDQLSAHLASAYGALDASSASASSSAPSTAFPTSLPPSPPPGRSVHYRTAHSAAGGGKKFDSTEARFIQNAFAAAVIVRLHRWCCQLFWLTIVCLIGYCSDQQQQQQRRRGGGGGEDCNNKNGGGAAAGAMDQGRRTFHEVRKSIVQATQRRGCKTVTELEMQLLRHLTCPQSAVLRPLRPSQHKKRHFLSRPPSPQLFDISEENDEQQQ